LNRFFFSFILTSNIFTVARFSIPVRMDKKKINESF